MREITETIFNGKYDIIPMADIQRFIKQSNGSEQMGLLVIMKSTKWDWDNEDWDNASWLDEEEGEKLLKAWCYYRHELDGVG